MTNVALTEDDLLAGLEPGERRALQSLLERAASDAAPGDDRCAVVASAMRKPAG